MLNYVLTPTWRTRFASLERALSEIDQRPALFDEAAWRWSTSEPVLAGLQAQYLFAKQGRLTEPQARALVRISRTDDPAAELAAWTLIYQFTSPIIGVARVVARGDQALTDSVETAIAELYLTIQRIDLEKNTGSVFFALSRLMHKAVLRPGEAMLLEQPTIAPYNDTASRERGDLHADDRSTDLIDWECTVDSLTDFLAEGLVDALGWNRETRYFARRHSRLRAFVARRVSEVATGEHASAAAIAAELGESPDMIKDLQAAVNKVWNGRGDGFVESVGALLGQAA